MAGADDPAPSVRGPGDHSMNPTTPTESPARTAVTLVVLLSFAGVLLVLARRPGRATLWPAGKRPADARGAVILDEPPRR